MNISINNCNNIDKATIAIVENTLNIKFGINGTGKSTLSRAIHLKCTDEKKLNTLLPFKYLENNPENITPSVEGIENIETVSVFNESYIDQFIFKQDELIQNSFEIFIKDDAYNKKLEEIEKIISDIKEAFTKNSEIDQVISDLTELSACFGKSKSGYSAASPLAKGLGKGNKIENVPEGLESYSEYLKSDKNTLWIKWQITGNDFIELSNKCPYCTSSTENKKEEIQRVSKEYDAKSIEHLTKVLGIVERLGQYFSDQAKTNIIAITKNKTGLSQEEITYLKQIKEQIDTLREKMITLKGITFFTFEDVDKVIEKIESLRINLDLLPLLNSEETSQLIAEINNSLDRVLGKAGQLQGQINMQKAAIRKTIEERKSEINNFLKYAGYKYSVEIEGDAQEYKLKLLHHDMKKTVSGGDQHLSYGEKNAFSLVLFMYECLSANPSLIVLDDPISSFDKNKKYALLEMLFRGSKSLRGKTVLMLTHDLEPIIDMVKNLSHIFQPTPKAYFLSYNAGQIDEIEIKKSDVLSFSQLCEENIRTNDEPVIKLIYLRRLYETINDKGKEYQLISNLLHKRETPIDSSGEENVEMTTEDIAHAKAEIEKRIPGFEYTPILTRLMDKAEMIEVYKKCSNGYEKLQIFRIINDTHQNNVVKKYINETFHIENEYICQLNPCKYDIIPNFIVKECDEFFEQA